ncbi:succinate-semialdehyde dehydrogenase [Thiomicrospira sp. XS5]|jgi:succinate-semialdehyde dehydrogenase/glutarate-semialdehyde dehydrogenase|uniref:NAD-dependent succinate-semialdehyde dehydrogenase n=1 Tax=Thiomicrospira sp. XS5 TaxID=1775636 RepID=UPI000747DFE8|nr:NAD-dependent succinate-semialdehyde dehydrogenase [Thiomicrospira sp. XS5]KUJ74412.1 succinate-semialdehyde dehydrogenase [Thiomicrospira sp. XS5]
MFTATNPTTGEVIHQYPTHTSEEVSTAIDDAQSAFQAWRKTTFAERAELMNKVADLMAEDEERLARLMTVEMGKPIREAYGEVQKAAWCARHYAEQAEGYLAPQELASDASLSYVQHLPLGPLLGILPWNAPFWLAFRFCAPALMAGNTCLMKHDSHVPACAEAIGELFVKAGAPKGLMQNLRLHNDQVAQVITHPAVQAVSLTGSSFAGSQVASLAAQHIKPAVLELGGSDPSLVLADADIEKAAEVLALSRIINAGQSCIAAKRIIVEAPVYEAFIDAFHQHLAKLKMGDPAEESTQVGPIAREDLREGLHRQVTTTVEQGGRCLLGGEMPVGKGFFYPVTLLVDVTPEMQASCEETFGPIAVVMKAESEAEAMRIANDTQYGLAASIWTADAAKAQRMASDIEAGQVAINGIVKTDPRLPSGGIKRSGYGRELGPHGILEFVNVQQVWVGPAKT